MLESMSPGDYRLPLSSSGLIGKGNFFRVAVRIVDNVYRYCSPMRCAAVYVGRALYRNIAIRTMQGQSPPICLTPIQLALLTPARSSSRQKPTRLSPRFRSFF